MRSSRGKKLFACMFSRSASLDFRSPVESTWALYNEGGMDRIDQLAARLWVRSFIPLVGTPFFLRINSFSSMFADECLKHIRI